MSAHFDQKIEFTGCRPQEILIKNIAKYKEVPKRLDRPD
jgi:hypothetical protein